MGRGEGASRAVKVCSRRCPEHRYTSALTCRRLLPQTLLSRPAPVLETHLGQPPAVLQGRREEMGRQELRASRGSQAGVQWADMPQERSIFIIDV